MNNIILRGFDRNREYFAVRKTLSPNGNPTNVVIEVEPTEQIRKEYQKQQNKFTKRKDWKTDRGIY